jgi:Ca-activated chloride channel family protein
MFAINHFAHPWLLLLFPIPVLLLVAGLVWRRQSPSILFSGLDIARGLPVSFRQRVLQLLPYTRCLVLMLGVVALARPQYGTTTFSSTALGVDIALVLDVSGSMQEQDYPPNRLEAAKAAAISFIKGRTTDRISVVVFGVSAALLCPPTLDMNAAAQFVAAIHDQMINGSATAVGDGLALAVSKLKDSEAKSRVVILLTDGESNSGNISPTQAAEIARALDVRVYTIGMGRAGGGGGANLLGGLNFLPSGPGFNEDGLKEIARITGGRYFRSSNNDGLKEIYREIDQLEKTEIEVEETTDYDERFHYFWFPALLLLGLEFLLRAFWLRRLP